MIKCGFSSSGVQFYARVFSFKQFLQCHPQASPGYITPLFAVPFPLSPYDHNFGAFSVLNRTRKKGDGFLQSEACKIGIMVLVIISILIICALAARSVYGNRRNKTQKWKP